MLGINDIVIGLDENISQGIFEKFLIQYELLLKEYYYSIKNDDFYCIDNIALLLSKIFFERRVSSKCNAGRSYFTLSADGNLYTCHRLVDKECGKVCSVNDNILECTERYSINIGDCRKKRSKNVDIPCNICSFLKLCGGTCMYSSYINSGNLCGYSKKTCIMSKLEIKNSLSLITSLNETTRKKFIKYLFA